VPIWEFKKEHELLEFFSREEELPQMDDEIRREIEREREALEGKFCRGCGYCLPCPADINIPINMRIERCCSASPLKTLMTKEYREGMEKITECIDAGGVCVALPIRPEALRTP
jgi:predicted aldo/keto reductase-like oxidoreductase